MDSLKPLAIILGIIGVFIGITVIGSMVDRRNAVKTYNNGIHKDCGGKWELYSASKRISGIIVYHYKCSKCEEKFNTEVGNLKTNKPNKE